MIFAVNAMSIREVSERLNISYQAVSAWCKGKAIPDIDNLVFLKEMTGEANIGDFIITYDQCGFPCFNKYRVASYCSLCLKCMSHGS